MKPGDVVKVVSTDGLYAVFSGKKATVTKYGLDEVTSDGKLYRLFSVRLDSKVESVENILLRESEMIPWTGLDTLFEVMPRS